MKRRKSIQLMMLTSSPATLLIEQLRHAGVLSVIAENDEAFIVQINSPRHVVNDESWAETNRQRMTSFGINAVVVNAAK